MPLKMRWLMEANVLERRFLVLSLSATMAVMGAACGSVGGSHMDAGTGTGGAGTGGLNGSGGAGSGGTAAGTGGTVTGTGGTVTGTGGTVTGTGGTITGTGGTVAGTGGASDAGSDTRPADGGTDAATLPVSCQQIKQQNPSAVNGVFTIAPLGTTAKSVFCEMTVDGGGWTAFYVGDNGSTPGGVHFENAADMCTDPANSCLRRLPPNIDTTHDFAVKCGAAVAKFKMGAMGLDYFANGLQHGWQPLTGAVTIDVVSVAKANLVNYVWTGDSGATNSGWIVSGTSATSGMAFGNGYTTNTSWNQCNGAADSTSRVMLFYR